MHWQEQLADTALHGYRPGRRAEDVWMGLSMSVESALVDGSDLVGMSIDWSECFDTVPKGIAFQLAERARSTHSSAATYCAACTVSCEEGLLWRDTCEKEFVASNGVIQGCLLSVFFFFAKPPHEHLVQICESRDHNSNAERLSGRRWSSQ